MERDKRVAVVTDSATSVRPDFPEAQAAQVSIVPLEVLLWKNGAYFPYSDFDVAPCSFYKNMRESDRLPQSSGAITGRLTGVFKNLREKTESIVSIHITSKMSEVYNSAILAKNLINEEPGPKSAIEIIDSKLVSIATWFPVEIASALSKKMASLNQIKDEVNEVIEKCQIFIALQTFENLKKGGRGSDVLKAVFASALSIYPVIGFENGVIKNFAFARSPGKAREKMIEMVGDAGRLVRLAVVHTNSYALAISAREKLTKVFKGPIGIYDAGPSPAVHAGEGAVGVAFQTV